MTKFCQASVIVEKCAPGYVCIEESDSHTPNIFEKAFPCPTGYYCEEGAQSPILCPEGTFTNENAAKQMSECTICQPGKFCNLEANEVSNIILFFYRVIGEVSKVFNLLQRSAYRSASNGRKLLERVINLHMHECNFILCRIGKPHRDTELPIWYNQYNYNISRAPIDCPTGHYCPINSQYPTACPKGTYQPLYNQTGVDDCKPCLGGYYCNEERIGNVVAAGDKYKCPLGHFCPSGDNIRPIACLAGSFIDEGAADSKGSGLKLADSLNDCNYCPEHFYCERGTSYRFQYPCQNGYECPAGSGGMISCQAGYYC